MHRRTGTLRVVLAAGVLAAIAAMYVILAHRGKSEDAGGSAAGTGPGGLPGLAARPPPEGMGTLTIRVSGKSSPSGAATARGTLAGIAADGSPIRRVAVADAKGVLAFDGVPPGEAYGLRVSSARGVVVQRTGLVVRAGETTALEPLDVEGGTRIEGRVVDASGAGLAGAEVRWLRSPRDLLDRAGDLNDLWEVPHDPEESTVATVHADGAGRFGFDAGPAGEIVLRGSQPGFRLGFARIESAAPGGVPGPVTITLAQGGGLMGRVVDEVGEPVPGARIVVRGDDPDSVSWNDGGTAVAASDGSFRVALGDPSDVGGYAVHASHPDFARTCTRVWRQPSRVLVLVLARGVRAEIHLTDAVKGLPLADVRVSVQTTDVPLPWGRARTWGLETSTTGSDGTAVLRLRPGFVRSVYARSREFGHCGFDFPKGEDGMNVSGDPALRGGQVTHLEARVRGRTFLVGRVLGPDGGVVPRATLRWGSLWGSAGDSAAVSSAGDGTFRIELPRETTWPGPGYLVADAPGIGRSRRVGYGAFVPEPFAAEVRRDIELLSCVTLLGRVTDIGGRGVAGARIRVAEEDEVLATTTSDGSYVAYDVPADPFDFERWPGKLAVRVEAPGFLHGEAAPVAAAPGDVVSVPAIVLRRGLTVSGRVVDPAGNAIAGATVRAEDRKTRTGADGAFRIAGLREHWDVRVYASAPGWCSQRIDVDGTKGPEVGPIEFRLDRGAELRGRVLVADGLPVVGLEVLTDPWFEWGPVDTTQSDGSFLLQDVPVGRVTLYAWWRGRGIEIGSAAAGGPPTDLIAPAGLVEELREARR